MNTAGMDYQLSSELTERILAIRLVAFDFDGVFTDNTVFVDQHGVESIRCWRGDGIGTARLERLGVATVVISSETNPVVEARCRKLGIAWVQGCLDKSSALETHLDMVGCRSLDEVAFVGNDINDACCLRCVGLPIVVCDAHPDVAALGVYTTRAAGGHGAVREVCDLIRYVWIEDGRPDGA